MKKIIVAPLDWGLGHATRCIPIIHGLLARDCEVFIAGSGESLALLKIEFPSLTFFRLPAYNPVYPSSGSMGWKMAGQVPKFVSVIRKEHRQIESLIEDNKIDLVISDNRYGCWSAKVTSVIITHQINIQLPGRFNWLKALVNRVNVKLIKRFSCCWIPDYPDAHSLAGSLTTLVRKGELERVKYIGNLSRFRILEPQALNYDVVCILSGPEPQRAIFERIVVKQVRESGLKYFIVRGLPSAPDTVAGETNYANFLRGEELQSVIEQSACVIARSGYSTVMDLAKLGKRAIFIPTPGQTEQEYLAGRLQKMKIAFTVAQEKFDIETAWEESKAYTGFHFIPEPAELLDSVLDELLPDPTFKEIELTPERLT